MAWFKDDVRDFFLELELNNNREWFEKNKKRYESQVRKPMEAFAQEMINRMKEIDPQISIAPKDAIFRIYRDIRFSKDKTPYKTNLGLSIGRGLRADNTTPGLYCHLDGHHLGIGSGFYMLEPAQLNSMRTYIAWNLEEFAALLEDPEFASLFGSIRGEKNKLISPDFREPAARQPLLFNKQFYYWAEYDADEALRNDLPDFVMKHMRAAQPMNAFLSKGIA